MVWDEDGQVSIPTPKSANLGYGILTEAVKVEIKKKTAEQKSWSLGQFDQMWTKSPMWPHNLQHLEE